MVGTEHILIPTLRCGFLCLAMFVIVSKSFLPQSNLENVGHGRKFEIYIENTVKPDDTVADATFKIPRLADLGNDKQPSLLHSLHVKSILSNEQATKCLRLATEYAESSGSWEQPDQQRHVSYSTCDFPVEDCLQLQEYLNEIQFDDGIFSDLSDLFGIPKDELSYLDFFCAHYQANKADATTQTMDSLEAHRDGSLLSFTITLSPPNEFEGGGTFFDALRDCDPTDSLLPGGIVRPLRAGDGVLHCGKLLHGADVVTHGKRTVLVGFIDVADWRQRPGALSSACRDWGRMDVALNRYNRQKKKKKGWFLSNSRWLPQASSSYLKGFCPAFDSVRRRAEGEYQRRKKLEAEDKLLSSILLQDDETDAYFGEDVTIF